MTIVHVVKKNGALWPADSNAAETLAKVREGREIMITARAPRSTKQHRFFWHMCRLIAENSEEFGAAENVSDMIKIGTGHYDIRTLNVPGVGEIFQHIPKSIAFESMSQIAFQEFMDKALDYVAKYILPGISKEMIRMEIEQRMLGP